MRAILYDPMRSMMLGNGSAAPAPDPFGPEIFTNTGKPYVDTSSYNTAGGGVATVDSGELFITSTGAKKARAYVNVNGLIIGKTYRLAFEAYRPAGGLGQQRVYAKTIATDVMPVDSLTPLMYEMDIIALAAAGTFTFQAAVSTSSGEQLKLLSASFREVLTP